MLLVDSSGKVGKVPDPDILPFIMQVNQAYLRAVVERVAIPRHRFAESKNNATVAQWIMEEFKRIGLNAYRQGEFGNIVAAFDPDLSRVRVLVGAHFDSVPRSPGADDNASAVAAMLATAAALSIEGWAPVAFVAFNGEEDGMLGSQDFVRNSVQQQLDNLETVHILEMVGYSSDRKGSQRAPAGLPVTLGDRGDFIGIVANRDSNHVVEGLLETAASYVPALPVKGLKVLAGVENLFRDLLRSDHWPFWAARVPTLMWTDTSDFRNPNYHQQGDVPDTLNYRFLEEVTMLLVAHIAQTIKAKKGHSG